MKSSASAIIVSYNTRDLLRECLQSLTDSTPDNFEIFVVDNASGDGSPDMIREEFPGVTLLANTENLGFAAANNQAFRNSSGEYIFLLNPDARVEKDAVHRMLAFMNTHPGCGICGGQIYTPEGKKAPSARSFPCTLHKFFTLFGLNARFPTSRIFGQPDMTWLSGHVPTPVDWVPGTFTCLRRSMLESIGFFDERYYLYYEETDLCLKAGQNNWQVFYLPQAAVWHVGGASSKTRADMEFHNAGSQLLLFRLRSEALYHRKNRGMLHLLGCMGMEFFFHALHFIKSIGPGERRAAKRAESRSFMQQSLQALKDTKLGSTSPPRPW